MQFQMTDLIIKRCKMIMHSQWMPYLNREHNGSQEIIISRTNIIQALSIQLLKITKQIYHWKGNSKKSQLRQLIKDCLIFNIMRAFSFRIRWNTGSFLAKLTRLVSLIFLRSVICKKREIILKSVNLSCQI